MYRVAVVLALATAVVVYGGAPALAHFDATGRYTHVSCPGTAASRSDPVNVVFHGWGTWGRAREPGRVPRRLDLDLGLDARSSSTTAAAPRCTRSARAARAPASTFASAGSTGIPRWAGQRPRALITRTSSLFPVPCGHAVDANGPGGSGFDRGRDELETRVRGGGPPRRLGCGGVTRRASSSATGTTRRRTAGRCSSASTR